MKEALRTSIFATAVCAIFFAAPANARLFKDQSSYNSVQTDSAGQVSMSELTRSDVTIIQQRLASRGFYRESVDGLWGRRTTEAVSLFQESRGLPSDGRLTHATLEKLDLASDETYGRPQDIAPAAGPTVYEETVVTSAVYTTRGKRGFSSSEFDASHSTCLECVDGIYGHGGNPNRVD